MEKSNITRSTQEFVVRTITAFISLSPSDFKICKNDKSPPLDKKIGDCSLFLSSCRRELEEYGYAVQTIRIAANPFSEWLIDSKSTNKTTKRSKSIKHIVKSRLSILDHLLMEHKIQFFSLGPSRTSDHTYQIVPSIIAFSPRFYCSADISAGDVNSAVAYAECLQTIYDLGHGNDPPEHIARGKGSFRFCATACCMPYIPFFPAAKGSRDLQGIGFALGLENGKFACELLAASGGLELVDTIFRAGMTDAITTLGSLCHKIAKEMKGVTYLGVDTSLNPSLEEGGSVAQAIENLCEVNIFGRHGTIAAAAAIATVLQSIPSKRTGYCGIMFQVCEDLRLAELASEKPSRLSISQLLSLCSISGVGIDTLPISADCTVMQLAAVVLDIAALSTWEKCLSCRILLVPSVAGKMTKFDSSYLCNCRTFLLN